MSDIPLIQLKDIYKTYHTGKVSFEALKGVTLDINKGEYLSILGPSGSGKSTLMHILGCLSTPTSGSYLLDGKEVSKLTRNELAKVRNHKIGFVFQSFNLLGHSTALENVALPLVYRGISTAKRHKLAREMLAKFDLETHLDHRPNELSGGQQQRVAIARALVSEPEVILADEPTGNLDTKSGNDVIKIFEDLAAHGKTIIIVTHDLLLAERTNRVIKIRDGEQQR
jgi:putative ABC transport system ATP-binding protein